MLNKMTEVEKEEENPYLRPRAAKIARNQARLAELGLLKNGTMSSVAATRVKKRAKAKKQSTVVFPLRRSSRNRSIINAISDATSLNDREDEIQKTAEMTRTVSTRIIKKRARLIDHSHGVIDRVECEDDMPTSASVAGSARSISIDVNQLVSDMLGKQIDAVGKAAVMIQAARSVGGYEDITSISFNKYSGVQEWQNDALFLWINLGAPSCEVINEFLQGGQQVCVFVSDRMNHQHLYFSRLTRLFDAITPYLL
jgi:hypothetical protein